MKTLVTGGAGAVGLHLSKFLLDKGEEVVILDNLFRSKGKIDSEMEGLLKHPNIKFINADLCDLDLKEKLRKYEFNKVYHLASINGTKYFYEIPDQILKKNILGTINLLEWFSESNNNGKILLTSSSETYAGSVNIFNYPVPTDEKVPLCIEDIKNPRWSYGLSKIVKEALFLYLSKQKGFDMSIVRLHNIYGERMGNEHVIPGIIRRIIQKETPFKIYGAEDTRSFCYVNDFVNAIYLTMESSRCNGEIINIGDDKNELSIRELTKRLFNIAGYNPEIEEHLSPKGSVKRRCPSINKLSNLTGFENKTSLQEGLEKTYKWYKANYSKNE